MTFNIPVKTARAIFNDKILEKICKNSGCIELQSSEGPLIISIEGTEPERTKMMVAQINYRNDLIGAGDFHDTVSAAGQNIKRILKRLVKGKGIEG